jgi:hypothetical protein
MAPWLRRISESSALMGSLLWIIHPELYHAGMEGLKALAENPDMVKEGDDVFQILHWWSTPFSGYSIISNRTTPVHRDNSARPQWYDLLASFGTYGYGEMKLPGIGVTLKYPAGTLVALCGKLLQHEVLEVVGNRVCLAHYMRDNVHERLNIPAPGWMTLSTYGS